MTELPQRLSRPLPRRLRVWGAAAFVASNMLGVGIFATSALPAEQLGHPLLALAVWFAGAALAIAGGLCHAELVINLPRSGGEYVYLREAYGPIWAFAAGWLSFVAGFSAPIAVIWRLIKKAAAKTAIEPSRRRTAPNVRLPLSHRWRRAAENRRPG